MADDKVYASVGGFIQFDIDEREYNGGTIRDATIRSFSSGDLIRISIWPDFEHVDFERGDVLYADGPVTERTVEGKTYVNMNARKLAIVASETAERSDEEPTVVKKSAGRKTF